MTRLRQLATLCGIALLLGSLNAVFNPNTPPLRETVADGEIALDEVLSAGASASLLWVDAREPEAFAKGTIPGAVSCPASHFDSGLEQVLEATLIKPPTAVVVFCDSSQCNSSHEVAERLREALPETAVWVLHGGWEAWLTWQDNN